jgi:hypothetical protein
MMHFFSKGFCCLLIAAGLSPALAADLSKRTDQVLERISSDILRHTDTGAVAESLYAQMRPRVLVRDASANEAEIDRKTRKYIQSRYAPALIANYSHLYGKLASAHKHFSHCDNPRPMDAGASIQQALCLRHDQKGIVVRYLTRMPPDGWKTNAEYLFAREGNSLILKAIRLSLPKGAKVRIGGL